MRYTIAGVVVLLILGLGFYALRPAEPATEEQLVRDEATTEESAPNPNDDPNGVTPETMTEADATMPAADAPNDDPAVSQVNENLPNADDSAELADGTYTTRTSYFTPRRTEHVMDVTLTIEDNIITDASILWDGEAEPKTPNHTGFDEAYKAEIIGEPLNETYLSRVGGASLTTASFNEALKNIEAEASAS